jgi:hypothetical protein
MRVIRKGLVALGVVAASWVVGAAPAFAEGPPVPAGCSFDQANGVLYCTTTTTRTVTEGPFTTTFVPVSTVFGDFTGLEICEAAFGPPPYPPPVTWEFIGFMFNVFVTGTVSTATTTQTHGLHGKVFATSSTSTFNALSVSGGISCVPGLP